MLFRSDEISSVIKKIEDRMINIVVGLNQSKMIALDEFINRLMILDPSNVIKSKKIALNHLYNFMVKHINELVEVKKIKFLSLANQLRSIGPENVLKRGFSIAINKETKTLLDNNIRLEAIGNIEELPKKCQSELKEAIEKTKHGSRTTLILALSYSSRWEIINAIKQIVKNEVSEKNINEELFSQYLTTKGVPNPELLIRTSVYWFY